MIWSTGGMIEGTTGRQRPPYIDKCEGFWPQGTGCEILLQKGCIYMSKGMHTNEQRNAYV
jgi:hypothetical protein